MARIFGGHFFSLKHVTEMPAALGAGDLRPQAVGIPGPDDGTRKMVVKAGPTAAGMKFDFRCKQRVAAAPTNVYPRLKEFIILTGKRRLRCLTDHDGLFVVRQRMERDWFYWHSTFIRHPPSERIVSPRTPQLFSKTKK